MPVLTNSKVPRFGYSSSFALTHSYRHIAINSNVQFRREGGTAHTNVSLCSILVTGVRVIACFTYLLCYTIWTSLSLSLRLCFFAVSSETTTIRYFLLTTSCHPYFSPFRSSFYIITYTASCESFWFYSGGMDLKEKHRMMPLFWFRNIEHDRPLTIGTWQSL